MRKLATNVVVDEVWYGPDYGNADRVPEDVAARIGDHAWEPDAPAAAEASEPEVKPLDKRTKGELIDLAEAQDPPIDSSGTKNDILERLQAAGVES
jgi:hypothetical protein